MSYRFADSLQAGSVWNCITASSALAMMDNFEPGTLKKMGSATSDFRMTVCTDGLQIRPEIHIVMGA
jgi:hypothetical protein